MRLHLVKNRRFTLWSGKFLTVGLAVLILGTVIRASALQSTAARLVPGSADWHAAAQGRVEQVGQGLVANSPLVHPPHIIHFRILESPGFTNAFVLPRGQVYLTRGLVNRLATEGELAAVLSHELGHVWMGALPGSLASGPGGVMDAPGLDPLSLQRSRENELQADFLGMCLLARSGYDPANMVRMVEVFKDARAEQGRTPEAHSTHPDPDFRIRQIQANLERLAECPD